MSWRTIVISNRAKLDLKMGYMVVRSEDTKRVLLDEISIIIIENTAVSLTGCLISELTRRKIKVIFCDEKRNPSSELVSIYGCHDNSAKLKKQLEWSDDIKAAVWTEIVSEKIRKQKEFLYELNRIEEAGLLHSYIEELEFNDVTNREGHAAKVYFNAVFGMDFTRSEDCVLNTALNYGYSIILSTINREVVSNGYLTQLGLFHDNVFNSFNLSCDLMEPFRVLVDRQVHEAGYIEFGTNEKHDMVSIMQKQIYINDNKHYLINAIKIYCRSVFDALNDKDVSKISFYSL